MEISDSITIEKNIPEVFNYLTDISNRADYIPQLKNVVLIDNEEFGQGSRYIEYSTIAGREFKTTYQVVAFDENRKISVATLKSVFPIRVDLLLNENNDQTEIHISLKLVLKGIYAIGAPVIELIVRQQTKTILNNLKTRLEGK